MAKDLAAIYKKAYAPWTPENDAKMEKKQAKQGAKTPSKSKKKG